MIRELLCHSPTNASAIFTESDGHFVFLTAPPPITPDPEEQACLEAWGCCDDVV